MRINVHIERLILDGLPMTRRQGEQVQGALEKELARLLATRGLSHELGGGIAVPRVPAGVIQVPRENHATRLGREVARAVHGAIGEHQKK